MSKASDFAFETIKRLILNGELKRGEQLKEEQLALRCGVSRTPVRDALLRLEAEFLIERRDNQRCFVADPSEDEIEELFSLRAMLEGHAAARAAKRSHPALVQRLKQCMGMMEADAGVARFLEHNAEFHRIIVAEAGSRRLAVMLAGLVSQSIVARTAHAFGPAQIAHSVEEHRELLEAIERGDAEWARALMTAHVRRAFHVYVQFVRRAAGRGAAG